MEIQKKACPEKDGKPFLLFLGVASFIHDGTAAVPASGAIWPYPLPEGQGRLLRTYPRSYHEQSPV
ncbi:MAG TPA: hypothetical protein PLX83_17975 [bacterium]|nr:hypothetical protein [bacterium]